MVKEIIFNDEARQKLKQGVDILANAVKVTLGPKGRNVIIEKSFDSPHITKDGVSVAKEIELKDPIQNLGAHLVREVASKTCDDAGDGTTTATVLAQAIINTGLKNMAAGANPIDLKRGIDKAVDVVVNFIKDNSIEVDENRIREVATISANNDDTIGGLIAAALKRVSKDGVILVDESKGIDTYIDIVEGTQFNRGFLSPYFITDSDQMSCIMNFPYVLISSRKISNIREILNVLEISTREDKPLFIITDDISEDVLSTLVMNRIKGNLKVCVIKAPDFGENRVESLKDLSALVGGIIVDDTVVSIARMHLGSAEKITITKDYTTIVNRGENKGLIQARVNTLKKQLIQNPSQHLQERIAKLAGGVAILHIGASSEVELKEKKDSVDDALSATRAAIEEGIVPGGGITLLKSQRVLRDLKGLNDDETTGINIVFNAVEVPLRQILRNAGISEDIILTEVIKEDISYGYNVRTNTFCNLLHDGVIDPAKVTRTALQNAASIAGLFLTTECAIASGE